MTPVLVVQLYLGPDDGDEVQLPERALPPVMAGAWDEPGAYVRDAGLDLVRADGTPVHRYRWRPFGGSRPPGQAGG